MNKHTFETLQEVQSFLFELGFKKITPYDYTNGKKVVLVSPRNGMFVLR